MLRALAISFLLALSLGGAAGFPPLANNGSMEFISIRSTRQRVRCGQQLAIVSKVRLNSFGDADRLYCALQQTTVENTTAHFEVKEFINRFKNVNTRKFELNFGEDNPASDGSQKFFWIWHRDGRLWSEGLDYTLRVVTKLDSATEKIANWRFYCETKKENFTSHYYWPKTDPRVQLSTNIRAPCARPPPKMTARGPKQKQ